MAEKFDGLGIRAIFMELAPDSSSEKNAALNAINLGTASVGAPVVGGGLENRSGLRR